MIDFTYDFIEKEVKIYSMHSTVNLNFATQFAVNIGMYRYSLHHLDGNKLLVLNAGLMRWDGDMFYHQLLRLLLHSEPAMHLR